MPTTTYTPIASVTLSASASEVVFSGLPQTYRDLILVFSGDGTTGGGAALRLQLNGDTATNYFRVGMWGNGSSSGSFTQNNGYTDIMNFAAGRQLNAILQFMDYSVTDKQKTFLARDNDAGFQVVANANRWASTSAITSIRLFASSGSIASGSTFNLFGVIA